MHAISKTEALIAFEAARDAAETLVSAQMGFYDPTNRKCVSLYFQFFENLLDERLRHWKMPKLMAYLYC